MDRVQTAIDHYSDGCYCSQSVLASFPDETGLTEEQALGTAFGFGCGMMKGSVCGACTGALMVIGCVCRKKGYDNSGIRKMTEDFLEAFRQANGSYICNELLGDDISTAEGLASVRKKGLFSDFCPHKVESAVVILEKMISDLS